LADAGYCLTDNIDKAADRGHDLTVTTGRLKHNDNQADAPPGRTPNNTTNRYNVFRPAVLEAYPRFDMKTAICVSPHPDDEILGASGALLALRDQGWGVTNLAVSLGRPLDVDRRRKELYEATARVGFANEVADPPINISSEADEESAVVAPEDFILKKLR